MTVLASHRRGDTFGTAQVPRRFTLTTPLTGATFTGGVRWTLRSKIPGSSSGGDGFVAQASSEEGEGDGAITFTGEGTELDPCIGSMTFPASSTAEWPARDLFWDLEGIITGTPPAEDEVITLDSGEIPILPDVTLGPGADS